MVAPACNPTTQEAKEGVLQILGLPVLIVRLCLKNPKRKRTKSIYISFKVSSKESSTESD
jgi:hypothetical protein